MLVPALPGGSVGSISPLRKSAQKNIRSPQALGALERVFERARDPEFAHGSGGKAVLLAAFRVRIASFNNTRPLLSMS